MKKVSTNSIGCRNEKRASRTLRRKMSVHRALTHSLSEAAYPINYIHPKLATQPLNSIVSVIQFEEFGKVSEHSMVVLSHDPPAPDKSTRKKRIRTLVK